MILKAVQNETRSKAVSGEVCTEMMPVSDCTNGVFFFTNFKNKNKITPINIA